MFDIPVLLALIVLVALIFDFTNGAHDCANAIATVVSTKVVTPRFAVGAAALLNLAGALLGTEVAKTLGSGIVLPQVVEGSHVLVLAALVGAIVWNCIAWYFGIPSSSSHALIGGLIGAAVLHHWKLPLVLTEPINLHHSPELATSFKMEARLLAVANCLARYSHDTPATLGDDVLEYLPHGCDPETVSAAVFQSMANAQSAGFAELNA